MRKFTTFFFFPNATGRERSDIRISFPPKGNESPFHILKLAAPTECVCSTKCLWFPSQFEAAVPEATLSVKTSPNLDFHETTKQMGGGYKHDYIIKRFQVTQQFLLFPYCFDYWVD
ncbi:hypothetical protein CEXT_73541 [Caerostris extrusa]|uniref:Uncharacterized protein n=1 Tax=Caerostris extrusa TaxID=172846 RepID=A0AAV4SZR6_CAEEX|nr:hypothetical protein CEXT_73541 [Caerostris extrusa]